MKPLPPSDFACQARSGTAPFKVWMPSKESRGHNTNIMEAIKDLYTHIYTRIRTLHYISLHCIALHCITLHYITIYTLHYITSHHITCMHTYITITIDINIYLHYIIHYILIWYIYIIIYDCIWWYIMCIYIYISRTAPHGVAIFALNMVKHTGIYSVLWQR